MAADLFEHCQSCNGTYCCPDCHPISPGYWLCGGCDGKQGWWSSIGPVTWIECGECDTGWTPCEECDGAEGGCWSCVPCTPRSPLPERLRADDPEDRCSRCDGSRVCTDCGQIAVAPDVLRLARERAGWSWAEAGDALGVSAVRLQHMEANTPGVDMTLRGDRLRHLMERARLPMGTLGWSNRLFGVLGPVEGVGLATFARSLNTLLRLGDAPEEGESGRAALRRRLGLLAQGIDDLDEGAAEAIREFAELLSNRASELGTVVAGDEERERLQRLEELGEEVHRAEKLRDLAPWLGVLFDHDPSTRTAFDRVVAG